MPMIEVTQEEIDIARLWLKAEEGVRAERLPTLRIALEGHRNGWAMQLAALLSPKLAGNGEASGERSVRGHIARTMPRHVVPVEQGDADEVAEQRRAHGSLEGQPGVGTGQVIPRTVASR